MHTEKDDVELAIFNTPNHAACGFVELPRQSVSEEPEAAEQCIARVMMEELIAIQRGLFWQREQLKQGAREEASDKVLTLSVC